MATDFTNPVDIPIAFSKCSDQSEVVRHDGVPSRGTPNADGSAAHHTNMTAIGGLFAHGNPQHRTQSMQIKRIPPHGVRIGR
jgi:hypothetical protein